LVTTPIESAKSLGPTLGDAGAEVIPPVGSSNSMAICVPGGIRKGALSVPRLAGLARSANSSGAKSRGFVSLIVRPPDLRRHERRITKRTSHGSYCRTPAGNSQPPGSASRWLTLACAAWSMPHQLMHRSIAAGTIRASYRSAADGGAIPIPRALLTPLPCRQSRRTVLGFACIA
jgi:hypothetical protein